MNETVYYKSPVGVLEIGAVDDALAKVHFLNTERSVQTDESSLDYKRPKSTVLKQVVKQLNGYFSGKLFEFNLPLNQEGTAFQQKVWNELPKIAFGHTCSYHSLSKKLGDVKAIRAVGTANGRNNIAIIVPCHRVIGKDGSLVGYGGDLWRKKWLLAHEAKFAHGVQTLF